LNKHPPFPSYSNRFASSSRHNPLHDLRAQGDG
jgi:hypothetical protein